MNKTMITILLLTTLLISGCITPNKNNSLENQKLCEQVANKEHEFTNPICKETNCGGKFYSDYCNCKEDDSHLLTKNKFEKTKIFILKEGVCKQ